MSWKEEQILPGKALRLPGADGLCCKGSAPLMKHEGSLSKTHPHLTQSKDCNGMAFSWYTQCYLYLHFLFPAPSFSPSSFMPLSTHLFLLLSLFIPLLFFIIVFNIILLYFDILLADHHFLFSFWWIIPHQVTVNLKFLALGGPWV